MEMNLEQLQSFVTVARLGHFTRAAEELHLAQPSLSRQISTLERDLGSVLLHRARGHIGLTAAGETLLPLAQRMLADAELARREVAELSDLRRGRVRLGATPTLCISLVAEVFERFHQTYPGIELQLTEQGSRGLVEALNRGALDLALITTAEHRAAASLDLMPLLSEELVVVASADRPPLTRRRSITLTELAEHPLVIFHEGYDLRATTDAAFRSAGLSPRVVIEGPEMDAVLRFVERGLGAAVVPAMVLLDRPTLRSVRLSDPRLHRTISLAHRSDVDLTRAATALQKMILTTADELAHQGAPKSRLITSAQRFTDSHGKCSALRMPGPE